MDGEHLDAIRRAASFFHFKPSTLAGVMVAEMQGDFRSDRKHLGEWALGAFCGASLGAGCSERSFGPAQIQLRRAALVQGMVDNFAGSSSCNKATMSICSDSVMGGFMRFISPGNDVVRHLGQDNSAIVYMAAYMGKLRGTAMKKTGLSFVPLDVVYSTDYGDGSYNGRDDMREYFNAGRDYYSYLDV